MKFPVSVPTPQAAHSENLHWVFLKIFPSLPSPWLAIWIEKHSLCSWQSGCCCCCGFSTWSENSPLSRQPIVMSQTEYCDFSWKRSSRADELWKERYCFGVNTKNQPSWKRGEKKEGSIYKYLTIMVFSKKYKYMKNRVLSRQVSQRSN